MPRRSQTTTDWLAVVCLVCFLGGTLVATARSLENRQSAWGALALLVIVGLVSLVKIRGRRLDGAIRNMLVGGLVSLVLGFVLLRVLVTYTMTDGSSPIDAELARQPQARATARVIASPTATARARSTSTPTVEATSTPTVEMTAEVTAISETPVAATLETATAAASCGQATVTGVGLNIRSGPGTGSAVVGSLPGGSTVELLCDAPAEANGVQWRHVRRDSVQGWVSGRYLEVVPTPGE